MLPAQYPSGFVAVADVLVVAAGRAIFALATLIGRAMLELSPMPVPLGVGLWHARHNALCELSMTRKSELESMLCTCALWQLPHSTFPLTKCTAPVVSCV